MERLRVTRPLGATLGDTVTKPHTQGGLQLGRIVSSLAIAAAMIVLVLWDARTGFAPAADD